MSRRVVARLAASGLLFLGAAAEAADAPPTKIAPELTVRVAGIARSGTLHVGLYDEASYPAFALLSETVAARGTEASVVFRQLPPGEYAVLAFLDLNGNGKADAGEPQAVSNGAMGKDFAAAAIGVGPGTQAVTLNLH